MAKRGKILIALASACGVSVIYLWFFGVATAFALEARYTGWKTPVVKRTPIELTDLSMSQVPGRKLEYSGYEFEVPWEVDEEKTRHTGQIQVIALQSGNTILFSSMLAGEFIKTFTSSSSVGPNDLKKLYGEDALESDYSLHRRILEATPARTTLFSTRRDAVSNAMLVVIKGIMLPAEADSGIFQVRTPGYEGFQYGDPQRRPKAIEVKIFANDGGLAFVFTQRDNGTTRAITQAEVNRVIQTVRKVKQPSRAGGGG
jgi:hypothetical protein